MTSEIRKTAESLFLQGCRDLEQRQFPAAESCFRQAVALVPGFGDALTNLAFVLDHHGDTLEAEQTYRKALAAGADSAQLHLNLGAILASQKQFTEARTHYLAAIKRDPQSSAAWSNLAALYLGLRQDAQAQRALEQALAIKPDNANAQFNLSYLHLRQGRFEEGWQCFEARDWYTVFAQHFDMPRWLGEPLQGKSIVIACEAGHGDAIHFARYVLLVQRLGAASITLLCHPALKSLMGTLPGLASVMGFNDPIARTGWDFWVPAMSLPFQFKTRADTIPAPIPYLHADPLLTQQWAAQLPHGKRKVGLVWKGNPEHYNDADRSLPHLQTLLPLWGVPGIDFISLQKGAGEDECSSLPDGVALLDLGQHIQSFADTAAIVSQLDLVVCVDTAIAHLAGALGRPCWVLLPYYMLDWRWGMEGTTTPWYPHTTRLFRQAPGAQWSEVVAELTQALQAFAQNA